MKEAVCNTAKDIVTQFAKAVQEKNIESIASLLADDGEFNTQDMELNTISNCNKVQFIDWLTRQLSQKSVTSVDYDTCILCRTGNPVVLFNDGLFVLQQEYKTKSRTGFMLHIIDGLIREIAFCFSFAHRENKSQMEYDNDEVNKLMAQGVPLIEAIETVLTARGCTDIWKGHRPDHLNSPGIYMASDITLKGKMETDI